MAVRAQTPPAAATNDEIVKLSEFQVSTSSDKGYRAGNSVSATRIDTPIKDLPFAISAFTQQFIIDIGARDLWDVAQYAPSVTSSGREFNAGNAVYTIRGFDQKPQHDGFTGDAYVDTVNVERVEVVKGPASVLYGQVSPGGTVNYITKRPQAKPAGSIGVQAGSYSFLRATADVNQPLVPGKALFRINGSWENGQEYYDNSKSRTVVYTPDVQWNITDALSLNVSYLSFDRRETAPAQLKPNIEVVAAAPASGILSGTGILAKGTPSATVPVADSSDLGFLSYYPLPTTFNYVSRNDWRYAKFETLNAELTAKLGEHWTARANYNWNHSSDRQKLTGAAAVNVDVPSSYTSQSPTYLAAAQAFAADILRDPNVALLAPHAQLGRRNRLQETFSQSGATQLEAAGKYDLAWVKLRPLVGAFYNSGTSVNRVRQTGSAGAYTLFVGTSAANQVANPAPWDFKNPAQFPINYDTDFNPSNLPLTTDTYSIFHGQALYGVLNASFLDDHLYLVGGLRYNRADSQTTNFLANAATTNPVADKFTTSKTTPQFGLGFKVTRDVMLYGSYSQSFVQNAGYLQIASQPGPAAKPTTAEGYELGVKTDLMNGRISSTIAVYQIDQKDRVISFNSFSSSGTTLVSNLQGTLDRSQGVEAEVTWSPLDNLQVYVSVAENDIRVKKVPTGYDFYLGSHPEATAKTLGNLWTRYSFNPGSVGGLWIGGGFNYVGRKAQRVNNPKLFLPSYTLWNAAVGYDWKWEQHAMSATLNWQNISDEEYFPANQQRGLPMRVVGSLTARF